MMISLPLVILMSVLSIEIQRVIHGGHVACWETKVPSLQHTAHNVAASSLWQATSELNLTKAASISIVGGRGLSIGLQLGGYITQEKHEGDSILVG